MRRAIGCSPRALPLPHNGSGRLHVQDGKTGAVRRGARERAIVGVPPSKSGGSGAARVAFSERAPEQRVPTLLAVRGTENPSPSRRRASASYPPDSRVDWLDRIQAIGTKAFAETRQNRRMGCGPMRTVPGRVRGSGGKREEGGEGDDRKTPAFREEKRAVERKRSAETARYASFQFTPLYVPQVAHSVCGSRGLLQPGQVLTSCRFNAWCDFRL
jgi:hypothetical protein